jgi:WD40 repeat protein
MRGWSAHGRGVWSLAFDPTGRWLATGAEDGRVRLWNPRTGAEGAELPADPRHYGRAAFSPDGRTVAVGLGREVWLCDPETGAVVRTLRLTGTLGSVQTLVFSPDGRLLALGDNGKVFVRDLAGRGKARRWQMGGRNTLYLIYSADGRWLLGSCDYGPVYAWDSATDAEVFALLHPPDEDGRIDVHGIALTADNRLLAAAYEGGTVLVWDVAARAIRHTLTGHENNVLQVAFAPDGRLASAAKDGTVRLWDVEAGLETACFDWGVGQMHRVAFSPDGLTLAAAGEQGRVVVWDV